MKIVHGTVFSKKIKGKWVLLESNKEYIRELNDTGSFVWELTAVPTSISEIEKKLSTLYKYPVREIKKDVKNFVDKFLKEGFLIRVT